MNQVIEVASPKLEMLRLNKDSGYKYKERRMEDWTENYTLYRDKPTMNRLIQRQSVNVPLMKMVLRTLLKDIDDMPVIYFENLDNDKDKELFQNEYWKWTSDYNKSEIQDIVDKRQVLHFGRTFDQWQIIDGKIKMTIQDPSDILVDRYTDPTNLHSSRFLIHTHIFKPLSYLESNEYFDQEAVARLKNFYASEQGLIKLADNQHSLVERNKKMRDMGDTEVDSPVLGETIVELSMHFVFRDKEEWDGHTYNNQIFLYVEGDNQEILMEKPLEKVIGETKDHWWQTHYPYNSWADDVDRQDFWTDAIADVVRTSNKILNSFVSQMVENRTLRNFNPQYYNSNIEGFTPGSFDPVAWGWYGIPVPAGGRIGDVVQRIDVPDLSESMDEMNFLIDMVEKATGASATQQGAIEQRQITLGEIKLALGEAKERAKGLSKFYLPVWKDRGEMFLKLIEAAPDKLDMVKIYKKGRNTNNIYSREIQPKDWMSESGYSTKVWSQDEKNNHDSQALEKLNATVANIPGNSKLVEIYQRRLLEFADVKPDDINEVMQIEQEKRQAVMNTVVDPMMANAGNPPVNQIQPPPNQPALPAAIN